MSYKRTAADEELLLLFETEEFKCIDETIEIKKNKLLELGIFSENSFTSFSSYKSLKKVKSALFEFFEALGVYYNYLGEQRFNDLYSYYDKMAERVYRKREYSIENFEQFFKYNEFLTEMDMVLDIQALNFNGRYIDKARELVERHCVKLWEAQGGSDGVYFSFPTIFSLPKKYDKIISDVDFNNSQDIIFKIKEGTNKNYDRKIVVKHFLRKKKDSRYYEMQMRRYFFSGDYKKILALHGFQVVNLKVN